MAGNKRKVHRYHIDVTSGLIFLMVFQVIALVFTFAKGCDVMYYAGFPMMTASLAGVVSLFCTSGFVEEQTAVRLRRHRIRDAVLVLKSALVISLIGSAAAVLLFYVLARPLCKAAFDMVKIAPVYRSFSPAIALIGPVGCLMGFLRGAGQKRLARMGMWMITALFAVLSPVCGFYWAYRGVKVGVLLLNEDMTAIYCGCGIAMGLDIAVFVTLICLAIFCRVQVGRLRPARGRTRALSEEADGLEGGGQLRSYSAQRLLPAVFLAAVPFLGILIGYRFWVGGQSAEAILTSVWGGFMGIGLPVLSGAAVILALPLTSMTVRLVRDHESGKERALKTRLAIVLRLSAYIGIPVSVFCFGAANEIVALFPNLTVRGRMAAIMTVKYGCPLVFMLQTVILTGYFYWCCRSQRSLILAAAVGFFAQIISLVVMSNMGFGIVMLVLSMDIYYAVYLITMYAMGQQDLIRGLTGAWMIDDGLIMVCALIAVIPIELLNDYLIEVLPGIAAFLVAAAVYAVLYLVLSVLLKAADLRNVEKLPGGSMVVSLAYVLGAVQVEED